MSALNEYVVCIRWPLRVSQVSIMCALGVLWVKIECILKGLGHQFCRVCCHNARGRVRNRKYNPEGPRDLTYCLHKPECIVTTNHNRSVLIRIITHYKFRPVNVSIPHLKSEYHVWSESRFACYFHSYITWWPLTMGIVTSQFPSSREAAFVTHCLTPFTLACLNSIKRFLLQ